MTDSMDLYASRVEEMNAAEGPFTAKNALAVKSRYLDGASIDYLRELNYSDRKALHNFKYFTWVEQQGRSSEDLRQLWDESFWQETFSTDHIHEWDRRIAAFNDATGVLKSL